MLEVLRFLAIPAKYTGMFENYPLSAAATRVLQAVKSASSSDSVRTLLVALWDDGSLAAELLARHGVGEAALGNIDSRSAPQIPVIISEAHRLAGWEEGATEIGTEHLLAALVNQWPGLLAQLGMNVTAGADLLRPVARASADDAELLSQPIQLRATIRPAQELSLLFRTLDAAANRAREGLRVVEDYVRFQLSDQFLSGQLKQLRHDLQRLLMELGEQDWLVHRDAVGDVGPQATRQMHAPLYRGTLDDVVRASCRRVEEALRTLEEFGKLVNAFAAAGIERLRYVFYNLEKLLDRRRIGRNRLAACRLYLLVTDRLCPSGVGPVVREAVAAGVDVVQLREKEMPDRRLIELAKLVRDWTHEAGALFIVNDRPEIAALSGADGVHLGQDDMSVAQARRIVGGEALIGVSTHHLAQARQAILDGADYLGVGPVFPSQTKQFEDFPGPSYVREVAAETSLPWFPLGGINAANVDDVLAAGATRIAVSSAIAAAPRPAEAARELSDRIATHSSLRTAARSEHS